MPSKKLIALAANAMEERRKELIAQPLSRIYPQLAEAAAGAILAALQDPTEAMIDAYFDKCLELGFTSHINATTAWFVLINASALGEKAE